MYRSATLIILASLFSFVGAESTPRSGVPIPIAKRTQYHDANGVADIARLQRSVEHSIAKFYLGLQYYQQNSGSSHPSAAKVKRLENRSIGSDPLVDWYSESWYGTLSVGTPPQPFTVNIDTGSSDLVLPSSICDETCNGHALYKSTGSSTANALGQYFFLGYGDGSEVIGTLYTDDVMIAGYMAKNQTFGAASAYSTGFMRRHFRPDGLLGLAFPSLSAYGATPVFQTLAAQGSFANNSFGVCLTKANSELYLGGTNNKLYKGGFTYVPLTQQGYWQTNFDALYLNGRKIAGVKSSVIDTGTSLILGDNYTVGAVYNVIPGSTPLGSGLYSVPCSFNTTISIQFGGANFVIEPQTFNMGPFLKTQPTA
ncbi:acid protease [Lactarius quietus]|nr:acid protease [Lactarius quietus]